MQQPTGADLIIQFIPLIILLLPFAIGIFWLAPKMRSNPWIWAILFVIPLINLFAVQIFLIRTVGKIFDRLNAIDPVAAGGRTE
jgi:hypothetical protein